MTGGRTFETGRTENAMVWGQEQEEWCDFCGRLSGEEGWGQMRVKGIIAHFRDFHFYSEWDGTPLYWSGKITRLIVNSRFKLLKKLLSCSASKINNKHKI